MATNLRKRASSPAVEAAEPHRRIGPALGIVACIGMVLGLINSWSNGLGSPYSSLSLRPYEGVFGLELLAAVVGTAWAWALVALGIGWFSSTRRRAALLAMIALEVAVVVYYVSDFASGFDEELSIGEIVIWTVISLVVGPTFGLAGHLARRPQWWSLVAGMAAPAVIVWNDSPFNGAPGPGSDKIRPWPSVVAWVVAGALFLALTLRGVWLLRHPSGKNPARCLREKSWIQ